jgi:tetratricopeptide (TPR) repeat protein
VKSPNFSRLGLRFSLLDGGLMLLMAAAAFALGCQQLSDADVWWHLRAGQWIWNNQKVPALDLFTFASADRAWINLHWLFQLALAAAFGAGGVRGMILMAAGGWTSVVLIVLIAGGRRYPMWFVVTCWLPALLVMSARFTPRPEIVSLLGVALYLAVLLSTDNTPELAWILPLVQIVWVNAHGLFVLGPIILLLYLVDRLLEGMRTSTTTELHSHSGRLRWWGHVAGATVLVGLTCMANPYGFRGVLLPLELFPKITAWGGQYKSYIIEFSDLKEFVRKQGPSGATSFYVRAECFLLWVLPVSFMIPAVWHTGRRVPLNGAWTKGCVGIAGLAVSLVLASALSFPGAGTPVWLMQLGRLAPFGLVALGVLSAAVIISSSRRVALLAMTGGASLATWVLWLRAHLLGAEPGLSAWLGRNDLLVLGSCAALLGSAMAVLIWRAGGRFFAMALAAVFSYLALQAIRNINLFGLVAGFLITLNIGEWATELSNEARAQERHPSQANRLAPRIVMACVLGLFLFTILSGHFFLAVGQQQQLGLREQPLVYAHEAARFAGQQDLPDRALVFDLSQAGVYVFHNGPSRKVFIDGRLEIPSRETFQTYVRLENMLNERRDGWAEPVRRMANPLILLNHEKEFGAEATLLGDPDWRCVYYDAIASVFLSRRRGLEASFPSVDFVKRHFQDPVWQAIPPVPWGLAEGKGLLDLGSAVQYRDRLTGRLPLSLRLLACDRFRQAIALDPNISGYWTSMGIACWNMILEPMSVQPGPSAEWDIATGIVPAQATFCFRRALELNPQEISTLMALHRSFELRGMRDAQQRVGILIDRARAATAVDRNGSSSLDPSQTQVKLQHDVLPQWGQGKPHDLALRVSDLLKQGRPEAATRLFAEAQDHGIAADWPTSDKVATALLHLGRPELATQVWARAAAPEAPSHREARIATAALAAFDYPAAERGYRAALKLDPTLGEAWLGLAWLYTQRGDSTQALDACQRGLQQSLAPPQIIVLKTYQTLIETLDPNQ